MNYEKIYNALVEKAKVRGLDKSQHEGYFEIHHIIPKCLGGSDDKTNLVMFTGREHFIAHMLLWKLNYSNKEIAYAARFMSLRTENAKVNSKVYENLKKITDPRPSKELSPKFKDKTGQVFGRLTVIEISHWIDTWGGNQIAAWKCQCSCGNFTTVASKRLTSKGTKSCGCITKEIMSNRKINPWGMNSKTNVWKQADVFYNLWYKFNKPTSSFIFTGLVNKELDTKLTSNSLNAIIKRFVQNWIPLEDREWVEFSKGS